MMKTGRMKMRMIARMIACAAAVVAGLGAVGAGADSAVTLKRPVKRSDKPHFVEAEFLPEHGMNLLQIRAYLPGKGVVELLASPSLADALAKLDGDDPYGNEAFKMGGAFLLPYPNRIRGKLTANGKGIEADLAGQKVTLPANWSGNNPGAELHAIHGLMLKAKFQDVVVRNDKESSSVSARLHAGDFGGQWPSRTDVKFRARLSDEALELWVTATNVGSERLPMAIGMHPYFRFPSGYRTQARVHLPAVMRAPENNYDDTFPLGTLEPVKGTRFDFTALEGRALDGDYLDDSFTDLQRDNTGGAEVRVSDPAAEYGIKVVVVSKEVKAIQMYAPTGKNFVAIEPQYNLPDPYDTRVWGSRDAGVVFLKPGEQTTWHVRFEIYGLK
jgi:galactose mutarotase-like enzyme